MERLIATYSLLIANYLLLALSDVSMSSKVTEESFFRILSTMSGASALCSKGKYSKP